jgi:hypothetical protein
MRMLFLMGLAALTSQTAYAQEFQNLAEGAVRHSASGWTFPKAVGNFQRVGDPEGIAGTPDGVATYEWSDNGNQNTATVYVYPPDTRAEDASLEGAKAALVSRLKAVPLAQSWSEGPFRAGKTPVLVGEKAFYKIGIGPDSSQTNLYYFDTGKWVVKIRLSAQKTMKGTFQALDTFVRDLPWDSLGLTAESCTGSACKADRAIAMHGMIPEQISILLVGSKLKEVFPREMPACEASALESALTAASPAPATDPPEPIEITAACTPGKGSRASFLRITLAQDMLDKLESESPDGLSLRGPITFVVLNRGKESFYTQMHDGRLDAATIARMLKGFGEGKHIIFARGDKNGMNAKPVSRFIADL